AAEGRSAEGDSVAYRDAAMEQLNVESARVGEDGVLGFDRCALDGSPLQSPVHSGVHLTPDIEGEATADPHAGESGDAQRSAIEGVRNGIPVVPVLEP